MTADQQPQKCPITGVENCADRNCELHYMSAPLRLSPESAGIDTSRNAWNGEQTSPSENADFFALLSREIDAKFPETEPVRIDKLGWELLHTIIDGVMAQGMARAAMLEIIDTLADDMPIDPEDAEAVAQFRTDLRNVVKLHKSISTVCKRLAAGDDIDLIVVPF